MSDINVTIMEVEPIQVKVTEEIIRVVITDKVPFLPADIFEPDADGEKVLKIQVKDKKLDIQYEGGE